MRLILCGGGHVSRALAQLGVLLEFQVHVIDDRPEFAGQDRFPGCQVHCGPFEAELDALGARDDDFFCVLTRGHAFDQVCVERLLPGSFAYLGMMGSRQKTAAVRQALAQKGFSQETVDKLHAPIGLDLGGQTPAEIAVEIAAQLLLVRSALGLAAPPPPEGPGILCTITDKSGSAPRGPGAWMLLRPDGTTVGSVGGGLLERQITRDARRLWESAGDTLRRTYDLSAALDMACGGQVTVLYQRRS